MVRKINLNGMERKELVKVIEKITGKKGVYLKPPTFSYRIGKILVLKDGSVQCPDDSDIFERLAEWSIFCEPEELELTVELPDTLTEEQKENLERLVESKARLIKDALGANSLEVRTENGKLAFPWFRITEENRAEEVKAYTAFVTALVEMVKRQKRITATEKKVDNEKYAFRCFLLRLGFIGDEYKTTRKILLRELSGSSAWKGGEPHAD